MAARNSKSTPATFEVTAPVKGLTQKIVGVNFVDSVATTDNEVSLAYFRRHGYKVEAVTAPATPPATPPAPPQAPAAPSGDGGKAPEGEKAPEGDGGKA